MKIFFGAILVMCLGSVGILFSQAIICVDNRHYIGLLIATVAIVTIFMTLMQYLSEIVDKR